MSKHLTNRTSTFSVGIGFIPPPERQRSINALVSAAGPIRQIRSPFANRIQVSHVTRPLFCTFGGTKSEYDFSVQPYKQ